MLSAEITEITAETKIISMTTFSSQDKQQIFIQRDGSRMNEALLTKTAEPTCNVNHIFSVPDPKPQHRSLSCSNTLYWK